MIQGDKTDLHKAGCPAPSEVGGQLPSRGPAFGSCEFGFESSKGRQSLGTHPPPPGAGPISYLFSFARHYLFGCRGD